MSFAPISAAPSPSPEAERGLVFLVFEGARVSTMEEQQTRSFAPISAAPSPSPEAERGLVSTMEEQTRSLDFSHIEERVDKLMGEFGKKIEKMNNHMVFNQYDSFLCDPLLPPKPPKLVVSSVLDDMIAAVEYETQSRDSQLLLRYNVSTSPKLAEVPLDSKGPQGADMPSAASSKDNPTTHHCSRFMLPWTILSPTFLSHINITSRPPSHKSPKVAPNSEETQVKDTRSVGFSKRNPPSAHNCSRSAIAGRMHPLEPVISHNVSRAKICEVADDSKGINGNDILSAGSLKENVPPTVRPQTMAKVAHISKGTQTRARQSVGSSKDNPGVHHFSPKTRHPPKPITQSFSRDTYNNNNKAKVARNSEGIQSEDRPSVGFSKENLIARQSSPTLQPQARHPLKPVIQNFARAPDDKIGEVAHSSKGILGKDRQSLDFAKENPSARQGSLTNWPQARHLLKPVSHNVSRAPNNKIGEVSHKLEGNQAKDRKSVGVLKENSSARQFSPTARPPPKLVSRNVSRTPDNKIKKDVLQGMQTNNIPSMGSSKESSSAHGSSLTMMPQKRQPPEPLTQNISRVRDSKIVKVAHNPEGTSAMGRQPAGFSKENPSACQCSPTTWPQARQPSKLSHNVSRSPIDKIDEVPHDSKGIQDKDSPYAGSLMENVRSKAGQHGKKYKFIDEIYDSHDGTKKQKLRSWGESQAGQHGKKYKFIDEIYDSHDGIAASDTGKSHAGQHADNKKIKFTDESCESYLMKQKKLASSSPSKILKTEKLAGRKRRISEVVSQKSADDDVDCASGLCGIKKKKASFLENRYLDTHSAVGQKKLGNFSSFSGQEGHLSSKNGSTHGHEVDHKESDNNQNTAHLCGLRHPTLDVGDVRCTIRKCNNTATIHVLKDATDLKDTAQRLEDVGMRIESTRLYFESALKFLHAASLLEPLGHDDIKCEGAIESIRFYAETSRICESCALAFERSEKLAAAALAYKCMEVTHFKIAFIQHSITSKDQKELQATFKMVNPGDSPSSFDPGNDFIKTPVWLDPSAMAKDARSPQTADNPVITAVSRPTYTRWLENTTEAICAFEAAVKAQNAYGAAINRMGKEAKGLSSVKDVLDTNFHNIEEILRLIELSMASINCEYR